MNKLSDMEQKKNAALFAVDTLLKNEQLHSNMKIGLGTGSTVFYAIEKIAQLVANGTLTNIATASTSFQTTLLCEKFNLPVYSMNSPHILGQLDFTIDGADECDYAGNLTKGGGAALLPEKILAYNSANYFIIITEKKRVTQLGVMFPIPIEIIPEARCSIIQQLESLGAEVTLREGVKKMGPVITDNGHFVLDARFTKAFDPSAMEQKIDLIVGVVECGLFTQKKPVVFSCNEQGKCSVTEA